MDATQPKSQMMVEYIRNILDNFTRCQTRQAEVEKGIVDLVQLKTEVWDINDDTGLETFISQQDAESDIYYTKVEKIRSDNLVIFEKCKSIIAPATAQTSRLTPATNPNITTGGFKPSQDLKVHVFSRHIKEDLPMDTKEDLHDVLEMTKAGSEHSKETHGDGSMKGRIIPETNHDKKGKVLYCQECNNQTPRIKRSKAKQKLKAHAFTRHKKRLTYRGLCHGN